MFRKAAVTEQAGAYTATTCTPLPPAGPAAADTLAKTWTRGDPAARGSFDDNPAHTRNISRERESWRVEKDGHERRRKKQQQQIVDIGHQHRSTRKRLDESERTGQALRKDLHDSERLCRDTKKALAKERSETTRLRATVLALEEELKRLQARGNPTLRDSDLLRQVRSAEQRVAELEAQVGNVAEKGGAGGGAGVPYQPVLSPDFLSLFDIAAPVGCASDVPLTNGAEWLKNPPQW